MCVVYNQNSCWLTLWGHSETTSEHFPPWHWIFTDDLDLQAWPTWGQGEPLCQISGSKVILFQNHLTDTHREPLAPARAYPVALLRLIITARCCDQIKDQSMTSIRLLRLNTDKYWEVFVGLCPSLYIWDTLPHIPAVDDSWFIQALEQLTWTMLYRTCFLC